MCDVLFMQVCEALVRSTSMVEVNVKKGTNMECLAYELYHFADERKLGDFEASEERHDQETNIRLKFFTIFKVVENGYTVIVII